MIKGLAEVALRTRDLESMGRFYTEVVGLDVVERFDQAIFLRVAEGVEGQTQMLVLFDAGLDPYGVDRPRDLPAVQRSTLHHLALTISQSDLATERDRLKGLGYDVTDAYHEWAKARSL